MLTVLAAAQDTGGANCIAPVISCLRQTAGVGVQVVASGKASDVFARAHVSHEAVRTAATTQESYDRAARDLIANHQPDAVLTGTSWGPSIDRGLASAARERHVPCVAVLDMWSYYRHRFEEPETRSLAYLPDRLAVMDGLAAEEAEAAGLPPERLVVTGQPYLEALPSRLDADAVSARAQALREAWLAQVRIAEPAFVVLFVAEPLLRDLGASELHRRGYTEGDALEGVIVAAEGAAQARGVAGLVVLRPHPEVPADQLVLGPLARERALPVADDGEPWSAVLASDVVVGMTSMLLLEAAFAQRPVISFQPSVEDPGAFVGCRLGLVRSAASVEALASCLETASQADAVPSETAEVWQQHEGAAQRVAGTVLSMAFGAQPARGNRA